MASITDHCTIYLDAPTSAVLETGGGRHIAGENDLTPVNVFTVPGGRGWMLQPNQYNADWHTTEITASSDPAYRKRLTAFTASETESVCDWTEVTRSGSVTNDKWLLSSVEGATLTTAGTTWTGGASGLLRVNPQIFIDFYLLSELITNEVLLTIEFGDLVTYDGADYYRWKLELDGLSNGVLSEYVTDAYVERVHAKLAGGDLPHTPFRMWISPCFRRSIFVWGTGWNYLEWADPDRDDGVDYASPDAATPLIPSGTLKITAAKRCWLQVTEAVYPATGTLSTVAQLDYAPSESPATTNPSGEPLEWTDQPTGTSISVATAAYGSSGDAYTVTATLTPDADRRISPTFYAMGFRLPPTTASRTVSTTGDLIASGNALAGLRYTVDQNGGRLELPLRLADEDVGLWYKLNRAVLLKCGADEIFRGYALDPEVSEFDDFNRVTFTCADEWEDLQGTILPMSENMDGWLVSDVITAVLTYCGLDASRLAVSTTVARTSTRGSNQTADTSGFLQADGFTNAGDFLRQVQNTYLNWVMDFAPVLGSVKFRFMAPWDASVAATLYPTHAAALAAGASINSVIRKWNQRLLKPECNDLLVVGQSPGGQGLYAWYRDEVSMDPRILEEARPVNWLGKRRIMVVADSSLSTQTDVNAVCSWMSWLTRARLQVTCECEWQPSVRYQDYISVDGAAYCVDGFQMSIEQDGVGGGIRRPATYSMWRYV